jgi:pSer/pThr/pTyr-binding forkhead associated (FHA) protein
MHLDQIDLDGESRLKAMTTSELPLLTVDGGPNDGKTMPIAKPRITLGRADDNDVAVGGPGVSRKHAEIVRSAAGYHLRDLGSTNGTSVNGINIAGGEHILQHGDDIRLGTSKVSLVFRTDANTTVEMPLSVLDSERAQSPDSAHEPASTSTSSRSPEKSILQYVESHPEGANLDTLRELSGRPKQEVIRIVAQLLDSGQLDQRDLRFFAAAGASAEHPCQEHGKLFERYDAGGIVLYAHMELDDWCVEGDNQD